MIYYMQVTLQLACSIFQTIVNLLRQKRDKNSYLQRQINSYPDYFLHLLI